MKREAGIKKPSSDLLGDPGQVHLSLLEALVSSFSNEDHG